MSTITNRSYSCKDEELPVIARYSALNFKRDLNWFTAFSSKFNDAYMTDYEAKIAEAEELVAPEAETAEKKKITFRIASYLIDLQGQVNRLEIYINMANGDINLSSADFGLSELRKGINAHDPEKVIDRLKDVNQKVVKYKAPLMEQGFTDALQEKLVNLHASLNADRQAQYKILTNRQALVQNNVGILNALYDQLKFILKTGKALFDPSDPLKVKEYTFSELKKRVRRVSKNNGNGTGELPETPAAS